MHNSNSDAQCKPWTRRWHPTPVLLPGKSHGPRSLVGCSPWGREELDTTERLHFHFSLSCIGEGNGNPLQCSCLENPRDGRAWWAAIYGVAQSRTRLKWLSSSNVNCRLWVIMAYRCTLVNYNKCTTFVQDVDIGEAVHAPGEEPSVLLVQFCCEPKTALKNKVLSKKKKKNTGVGSRSLFQGIFQTQGSKLGLLHCRQILYYLNH